jgi:hypothetical protein
VKVASSSSKPPPLLTSRCVDLGLFPVILQFDDAIGRKITITLDGVRDLAGNTLKRALVWSATISVRADTSTTNVLFSGLRVRIASTSVTPSFLTNLASSLANRLKVLPSTLINFKWTPSANGLESIFSFEIVTTASGGFRRDVSSQEAADMVLSDEFGDDFLSAWLAEDHEVRHSQMICSHTSRSQSRRSSTHRMILLVPFFTSF